MATETVRIRRKMALVLGGLALFALLVIGQPFSDLSHEGQHMLGVALLMGVLWLGEAIPIPVTALLPLVLFPILGIMPAKAVAPNYANHLIFLFLGGFMIALAMERWNLHKRIALWIIRAIGTTPSRVVLGFMVASAFLSMWISNTATTMMMLPVAMAVVMQIAEHADSGTDPEEIKKHLGLVLMLGLAYSASIGGVGTLIGTVPNVLFAGFYKTNFPDLPEIEFAEWMVVAVPVVVVFIPVVWWFLCRFAAPVPIAELKTHDGAGEVIGQELKQLGPLSRAERFISGVFVTTAFLWIFRKPIALGSVTLPGWSELFGRPDYLNDSTVAISMAALLMIVPIGLPKGLHLKNKTEFFVLDWKTVQTGVPWDILILLGGGLALAAGFRETGLDAWIGQQLTGVNGFPLWGIVLILCLGITFLTELTSNTATTTMMLPVIAGAAAVLPYHPLMLMVPVTISASFAFMMPVATPPNAIVFGSGWVKIPQMARAGLVLNLIGAVLVTMLTLIVVQAVWL